MAFVSFFSWINSSLPWQYITPKKRFFSKFYPPQNKPAIRRRSSEICGVRSRKKLKYGIRDFFFINRCNMCISAYAINFGPLNKCFLFFFNKNMSILAKKWGFWHFFMPDTSFFTLCFLLMALTLSYRLIFNDPNPIGASSWPWAHLCIQYNAFRGRF